MDKVSWQGTEDLRKDLTILSRRVSPQRVCGLRQGVGYELIFGRMSRIIIGSR